MAFLQEGGQLYSPAKYSYLLQNMPRQRATGKNNFISSFETVFTVRDAPGWHRFLIMTLKYKNFRSYSKVKQNVVFIDCCQKSASSARNDQWPETTNVQVHKPMYYVMHYYIHNLYHSTVYRPRFAYLFTKDLLVFSNLNAKFKHFKLNNILLRYLLVIGRSLFLYVLYPQQDCTVSQEPWY